MEMATFVPLASLDALRGALFWVESVMVVIFALMVVAQRSPVNSAMSLAAAMVCAALLMINAGAYFLGTVQILVYAGAVMVLFLFIIMLLDLREEERRALNRIAVIGGLAVFALVLMLVVSVVGPGLRDVALEPRTQDDVAQLGRLLFTKYVLPFSLTSVLLLVAIVGVILLCRQSPAEPANGRTKR